MARKSARRKHTVRKSSKESFGFDQLLTRRHRPLHVAGLGAIMMFLQGLFATIGLLLVIGAAVTYALRALKANK